MTDMLIGGQSSSYMLKNCEGPFYLDVFKNRSHTKHKQNYEAETSYPYTSC
jgi:hypothetical protein